MSVTGVGSSSTMMVQAVVDMRTRARRPAAPARYRQEVGDLCGPRPRPRRWRWACARSLSAVDGYATPSRMVGVRLDLAQTALSAAWTSARQRRQTVDAASPRSTRQHRPDHRTAATRSSSCDEMLGLLNTQGGRSLSVLRPRRRSAGGRTPWRISSTATACARLQAGHRRAQARRISAPTGLGRLAIPAAVGTVVSVAEDVAGSPFGFKLAGVDVDPDQRGGRPGRPASPLGDLGRFHRRQSQRRRDDHVRAHPARRIERGRDAHRDHGGAPGGRTSSRSAATTADTAINLQAALATAVGSSPARRLPAASASRGRGRLLQRRRRQSAAPRRRAAVRQRDRARRRHAGQHGDLVHRRGRQRSGALDRGGAGRPVRHASPTGCAPMRRDFA